MKRLIALIIVISLIAGINSFNILAEKAVMVSESSNNAKSSKEVEGYAVYADNNSSYDYGDTSVIFDGAEYKESSGVDTGNLADRVGNRLSNKGIIAKQAGSFSEYEVEIKKDGLYNFQITYFPLKENGTDIKIGLKIDGKYPFDEAQIIELPRYWSDDGDVRKDEYGNEYSAPQKELGEFNTISVYDAAGVFNEPFLFKLAAGKHKITLCFESENLYVANLGFVAVEEVLEYTEVLKNYQTNNYISAEGEVIVIEAESAYKKNSSSLVAKSDNSSPVVTPSDTYYDVCNNIGGSNWKNPNEEIVWQFNVEQSGLYKLGMVCKQDLNMNLYSYRSLKIDGKIPFEECKAMRFGYDTNWQNVIFGDDEPYLFYLEKGIHTLSLSVTLGDISTIYSKLEAASDLLGDLYLDIAMITGESPDSNRDYQLHKQIPDFIDRLKEIKKKLDVISNDMVKLSSGKTNSFIAAVNNMSRVVKSMAENSYEAQLYLSDYYNNFSTVTSWLYDMKAMSLNIDQIQLCPSENEFNFNNPNIFEHISFSVKRFFASFSSDYSMEHDNENSNSVELWVNWGRDQAMVLESLISEKFTPNTGIEVDLKITNAGLIKGMLSGNAPDVSLHLSRTEPVNLAMRGALYDLSEFSDFNEVINRFGESASIPYEYNGGVYALPDTQSFYVMFYRTDILEKLGINVPKTWDDFLAAVGVLQINNMNAWIPYIQISAASTVNAGVGGLNLYASILQQFGGSFYNEERNVCVLDNVISYQAFNFWTEMYTKYKLPTTANFYNRFRIGTMPIGIETYTLYTTLMEAAPEIQGRWGVALVPGIKQDDGTIDHTVAGSGTGCSILQQCENKEVAWEFLKWWTSSDTQLSYNNEVESVLGTISRTATANVDAFSNMSWDIRDKEILMEQRSYIREIPEVPGSYYVSRSVDQAFWNVVNNNQRPKDMLVKWSDIANNEIKRKIAQYTD